MYTRTLYRHVGYAAMILVGMAILSGCVPTVAQFEPVPREGVETAALDQPEGFLGAVPASLEAPEYEIGDGVPRYWPVEDPSRHIISWYGIRGSAGGRQRLHKGLDIRADFGVPLVSTAPGVVSYAGLMRGYGKVVMVDHGNDFVTLYAHMNTILVSKDQTVRAGEALGNMGRTGNASTHHIHYEVRLKGQCYDPIYFLPAMEASEMGAE